MRFEPSGLTNDADIRAAKSLVDYIFRWMGKKFLDTDTQQELGILSPEVRQRLAQAQDILENGGGADGPRPRRRPRRARPPCSTRSRTRWSAPSAAAGWCRTGSCYTCRDCGQNTGCS